jgi:predicted SnoaL-like aldol condensation-catalyzing enzyme
MSQQDDNKALIRHIIEEALNKGNFEVADGRFTDDYTVHIPRRPDVPGGAEGFKQAIGMWRNACSDWHMEIEEMIAEGDLVTNRFTTRGTNDGPLLGKPPTNKPFVVHGMEIHRVRDGKVAETWVCDDIPSILLQLEVIPSPFGPPGGGPP